MEADSRDVDGHPGTMKAHLRMGSPAGAMEADNGAGKSHSRVIVANPEAIATYPGTVEAHPGVMLAHPGAMLAQPGAKKHHPGATETL